MPSFKIGDRVVCIAQMDSLRIGATGTIVGMFDHSVNSKPLIRIKTDEGKHDYFSARRGGLGYNVWPHTIQLISQEPKRLVDYELDKLYAAL